MEELPKFSGSKASAAYLYRLRQVHMRHPCGAVILIISANFCFFRFLVEFLGN